jgi:hypothetical protein
MTNLSICSISAKSAAAKTADGRQAQNRQGWSDEDRMVRRAAQPTARATNPGTRERSASRVKGLTAIFPVLLVDGAAFLLGQIRAVPYSDNL